MLAFTLAPIFVLLGLTATVQSSPHRVVKRDLQTQLLDIASNLGTTLAPLEVQVSTALDGIDVTDSVAVVGALTSPLASIDTAIAAAGAEITALQSTASLRERQALNLTEIAEAYAQLIVALLQALNATETLIDSSPLLAGLLRPLLSPIDGDLAIILTGLGILLAGVLALVSDLLSGLAGALSGLGGSASGVLGL